MHLLHSTKLQDLQVRDQIFGNRHQEGPLLSFFSLLRRLGKLDLSRLF